MRALAILVLSLMLTACEAAAPSEGQHTPAAPPPIEALSRGAVSGQRQKIDALISVNPDCSMKGYWIVRVLAPPKNGRLAVDQREAFSNFPPSSPGGGCNKQRSPAILILYTLKPGYTKPDEATSPDGILRQIVFQLQVI